MKQNRVVNINKEKSDIYIGRVKNCSTHFGNPFSDKDNTLANVKLKSRKETVKAFEEWLDGTNYQKVEPERRESIINNLEQLRNKTLGCFCKPLECHGDILIKQLNKK
jgi:hypothetical protein